MGDRKAWTTDQVAGYLQQMRIPLRLACATESGWPMVLSLWYVPIDGRLYCATQRSAKVVRYLRRDPRCAFEVAADEPPYRGVRGQGKAILNEGRGAEILEILLVRYLGGTESSLAQRLLARSENEVAIEIEPRTLFTWDYSARMRD